MSFDTGPLVEVRQTIADLIDAENLGVTVHPSWGPTPAGPTVILDGGGWVRTQGCGFTYSVRVNVCYGDQSGEVIPKIEELTRQVWDVLIQAGYPIPTVPPVGLLKFGDREYPAIQMTCTPIGMTPED